MAAVGAAATRGFLPPVDPRQRTGSSTKGGIDATAEKMELLMAELAECRQKYAVEKATSENLRRLVADMEYRRPLEVSHRFRTLRIVPGHTSPLPGALSPSIAGAALASPFSESASEPAIPRGRATPPPSAGTSPIPTTLSSPAAALSSPSPSTSEHDLPSSGDSSPEPLWAADGAAALPTSPPLQTESLRLMSRLKRSEARLKDENNKLKRKVAKLRNRMFEESHQKQTAETRLKDLEQEVVSLRAYRGEADPKIEALNSRLLLTESALGEKTSECAEWVRQVKALKAKVLELENILNALRSTPSRAKSVAASSPTSSGKPEGAAPLAGSAVGTRV